MTGMTQLGAEEITQTVEKLQMLDCDFTALGYPPEEYHNQDGMRRLAEIFNIQAEKFAKHGIRLGYHNHDFEFEHFSESTTILETFYGNTNRNVCAELDVHWVTRGGGNPETWIRKLKNRIPVIHFKDFTVYNRQPIFCEIGQGNLDWTGILKACREAEVKTFVVEQDLPFPGRDVFESAKLSFDFLTSIEW